MPIPHPYANLVQRLAPWALLALLWHHANLFAWMAEDAFINFRVLQNTLLGLGPNWNPGERVQVYTSALWMALSLPLTALTHNPMSAAWLLSMALLAWLLAMMWVACNRHTLLWMLAVVMWVSSRSVRDYLCSGLETPLVMAAAASMAVLLRPGGRASATACATGLAVCGLVRHDMLLLLGPLTCAVMWQRLRAEATEAWPATARRLVRAGLIGALPLLAWTAWSWLYYGSPVPNTAGAKIVSGWDATAQAQRYFEFMQFFDPWAYGVIVLSVVGVWASNTARFLPLMAGLALFFGYMWMVGADYMAGRFFVGPITLCVTLLACVMRPDLSGAADTWFKLLDSVRARLALTFAILGCFTVVTLTAEHPSELAKLLPLFTHGIADERQVYWGWTDLKTLQKVGVQGVFSNNGHFIGVALADDPKAGPFVVCNIGMTGYYAPPNAVIIDPLALSDRFLAGLPTVNNRVRVGHFERPVPRDYLASRLSGRNLFQDPTLAAYYDDVTRVVSGPLLDAERLRAIWRLSTGTYRQRLRQWQPQDGGGLVFMDGSTPREQARGCLGGWGYVMDPQWVDGELHVMKVPHTVNATSQGSGPARVPKVQATAQPAPSSGG